MPMFVEDPANFSKSRLKSDLVAHNVKLPPAKSKKEVYVELHMKHIDQKKAVEFSSDEEEEDEEEDEEDHMEGEDVEDPGDAEVLDPSALTDDDLKAALLKHGVKAGPIVASTRFLYEKKLRKMLQSDGHHGHLNGAKNEMIYSDSEEEEEDNGEDDDAESSAKEEKEEAVEESDQAEEESSQVNFQNGGFTYPQCFLPQMRRHIPASRNVEPSPVQNSGNVLKSSERQSRPPCSQSLVGISRASSIDQRSGLGSVVQVASQSVAANGCSSSSSSSSSPQTFSITELVEEMEGRRSLSTSANSERELSGSNVQDHWSQPNRLDLPSLVNRTMKNQSMYYTPKASPHERGTKAQDPVKDDFKHLFPAETTPTGIYATRRRPIKGAAGRPIQYVYPDTPVSPTTLQRRDVERRLVPVHVQILFFVTVTCLLFLIYVCVEDNTFIPIVSSLDNLNPGSNSEEALLHKTEARDTPAGSKWE